MITKLYSFYELPFDHDICHIFEHAVMRQFMIKLRETGRSRAFFGWKHGQTIDSTIFFELGARHEEVARLFDDYLANLDQFDSKVISQSIAHIEAEMRSEITVTDLALLNHQLQELARLIRGHSVTQASIGDSLLITENSNSFLDIAIIINVYEVSLETQKAFLCFYPVLIDIIRDAAIDNEAAYLTGESQVVNDDSSIGVAWRFTAKKSVDLTRVENITLEYLQNFDVSKYAKFVDEYRDSFAHDPQYNAAPIQFYGQTGIETTREELAQIATLERLMEIMRKMTVRIEPVTGKLKNIDWEY